MEQVNNALTIMAIGMITVFLILWLVVLIGNVLIRFTNKYVPVVEVASKKPVTQASADSGSKIAAIVAAVDIVTKGKGKITNIKKV